MTTDRAPLRVALVDDYEVVVRGLARMFDSYRDRIELVEIDARLPVSQPVDIVLFDTFGEARGDAEAINEILSTGRVGKVVVYGWEEEPELIERTMARGASGFVSKGLSAAQLVTALEAAHRLERSVAVPPHEPVADPGDWPGRAEGLTAREAEVVALITQGLANLTIAEHTFLSINSVKSYIRAAYRKMGVTTRSQAVLWGVRHGFLPDSVRDTQPRTR
ncbi:MAG: response regulator transcription factor [Humibacillus sp.]|nr:response regulator transcription factor [Humibacillus sp.]MDN5775713.1 response regulator transcription factor [Humibacillus sp.]